MEVNLPNFIDYRREVVASLDSMSRVDELVEEAANVLISTIEQGGTVFFAGNGGSAADAQHLAAELMGRYLIDRKPMPSIALTVDTSALTAIANDYGFDHIFERQLEGIGKETDALVLISTSGMSKNLMLCAKKAEELGIKTIGLLGNDGGDLMALVDVPIVVPSQATNHIQELHIMIGHYLCGRVEEKISSFREEIHQ